MDLNILREIGEWAALGFYEGEALPWPRNYGLAYRRLYENMGVRVPNHRFLIPCEPLYNIVDLAQAPFKTTSGLICYVHNLGGLMVSPQMAECRKQEFPQYTHFIDELAGDLEEKLPRYGGCTHSNPDCRTIVDKGFNHLYGQLLKELEKTNLTEEENNYLLALKDYSEGVRTFYARIRTALEQAAHEDQSPSKARRAAISRAFSECFMEPSQTFLQGLLAVNFTWILDQCDSIGRFDQVLGPLFEKDLQAGHPDLPLARELIDELWLNFESLGGWNLQLGGYTPAGWDGYNQLTEECLDCTARHKTSKPNVAFRITSDTPRAGVMKALGVLSRGSGRPALYNDEAYLKSFKEYLPELSPADMADFGFGGCTETMITGMSNVGSLEGGLDFAKALERTIFNGFGIGGDGDRGPETGDVENITSYEDFVNALKVQIAFITDEFVQEHNRSLKMRFASGDPKLHRSFFTRDCIQNRKPFEGGGARYNWAVVAYYGLSNMVDGLAAIKKFVYDEGTLTIRKLAEALRSDFAGYDDVRHLLLSAPKYGNDLDEVDLPGSEVVRFAWERLLSCPTPRGGRYVPSIILFSTYADEGKTVGATPDGRKAFTALSDSTGATPGKDLKGPTALLNSVVKMPLNLAFGTPVLNLRFSQQIMSQGNIEKVWALIESYFNKGGLQAQISVLDSEKLRKAKEKPEDYADLIVRIGGYSEYFVRLSEALQDSVIERTENGC